MSFAKECHGITHRYIRSTKTQNALPESKREFPPYPSVASDGGDKTRRLTLAIAPKPYLENGATQRQARSQPAGSLPLETAPFWGGQCSHFSLAALILGFARLGPNLFNTLMDHELGGCFFPQKPHFDLAAGNHRGGKVVTLMFATLG
jgi:hypothetical protein